MPDFVHAGRATNFSAAGTSDLRGFYWVGRGLGDALSELVTQTAVQQLAQAAYAQL